jgi:DNA-directed RNA polymerase subunit F
VAIDILTHNDGIRHSGFEREPVETARGLLALVACALQYLHKSGTTDPNTDPYAIEELAEIFSFSEILCEKRPRKPDYVQSSAKLSSTRTRFSARGA